MNASEGEVPVEQVNLHDIAERLAALEDRIARGVPESPPLGFNDQKLGIIAASIYRARQRRLKHFDQSLFGEPAWDMLLDLFVKQVRGERVSVTSLCIAANTAMATGIRWMDILVRHGLAEKSPAKEDRRVVFVALTPAGYRSVRAYVSEGIGKFDMPAPEPI